MYEAALGMLDYLPIEAGAENRYIGHLWGAFEAVIEKEEPVRAFSILPFHLLFMLAVQFKTHRISAWKNHEYLEVLKSCRLYRKEDRKIVTTNAPIVDEHGLIPSGSSVRNLSKIKESHLFHFFRIIGLDENIIKRAFVSIEIRGSYAHANGNIEEEIEARIDEYLGMLRAIQACCLKINDELAYDWLAEFTLEDDLKNFVEERLLGSYLCSADFGSGMLKEYFSSAID